MNKPKSGNYRKKYRYSFQTELSSIFASSQMETNRFCWYRSGSRTNHMHIKYMYILNRNENGNIWGKYLGLIVMILVWVKCNSLYWLYLCNLHIDTTSRGNRSVDIPYTFYILSPCSFFYVHFNLKELLASLWTPIFLGAGLHPSLWTEASDIFFFKVASKKGEESKPITLSI